jgi:hypothetical protein
MKYATPELVVIGRATVLVLGGDPGKLDNGDSQTSKPIGGMVLGLDD